MFDSLRLPSCYLAKSLQGALLFVLLICSLSSAAQQTNRQKIDSLMNHVLKPSHDSLKMRGLVQLAARYWYNDLDSVQYFGNWAIGFVDSLDGWEEAQVAHWHGTAYSNLGAGFSIHAHPDTALILYDRAEDIFLIHDDELGLASVYGNRSYDYFDKGWYEMAYDANAKCLEINLKQGNDRGIALCYVNMGDAHSQYDRYELATEMYKKALEISKRQKDYAQICRNYHSMAGMQRYFDPEGGLASLDSAKIYIPRSIGEQKSAWANHLYARGKLYSKIGRYEEALSHIIASYDSALVHGNDGVMLQCQKALPALFNALERYDESIEFSEAILPKIEAKGRGHGYKHSVFYYSIALEKKERYKEALEQRILYQTLGDSLADLTKIRSIDEAQTKFKVAEKEREIAIRNKEKQALEERNDLVIKFGIGGVLALLAISGSVVLNLRNRKKRLELEKEKAQVELKLKEEEAIQLQEVERLKSRFFANISHEFRTPLTLILGPAHNIKKMTGDPDVQAEANTIERNGQQLLHLIDQLLELSRLENRGIELREAPTNIGLFVNRIAAVFNPIATEKKIDLNVNVQESIPTTLVDRDKLEKILFNLLSNAHKFTQKGGKISVDLNSNVDSFSISVMDNGPGISQKDLDKVFDRFYQTESGANAKGSGIGLALAKELSELMAGKITAESEPGIKTIFTISLPIKISEGAEPEESSDQVPLGIFEANGVIENRTSEDDDRPVLLLVEDNVELREYSRNLLREQYQVIEAPDGRKGLQVAKEFVPDIIITDVMMPDMDGNEMCKVLKSDTTTDHIPIVMLTAKSSSANKITGLEVGADDYLLKPFNSRELQLKLQNLLKLTKSNRSKYRDQTPGDSSKLRKAEPVDSFLIQVNQHIEEHLSDPEFSVEKLAELVLMSRSQLFRKLKALTEQTPVVYIRRMRLHKAKQMLQSTEQNVSEVCYSVGFSSPAYFSKAYKEEFGDSPSEDL